MPKRMKRCIVKLEVIVPVKWSNEEIERVIYSALDDSDHVMLAEVDVDLVTAE